MKLILVVLFQRYFGKILIIGWRLLALSHTHALRVNSKSAAVSGRMVLVF